MSSPWAQEPSSIIKDYKSSQSSGLTEQQLAKLTIQYGSNSLGPQKKLNYLAMTFRQFKSPMVYTLLIAAVIAMVLGELLDSISILVIVLINAGIGLAQEAKAETAIKALKNLTVPKTRVLRDGKIILIPSEEVLPGDILQLEAGDYVPADGRVLESYQLTANESILTGESLAVNKISTPLAEAIELPDRVNMVFAGTAINSGSGRAMVVAIGLNTELGRIANLLEKTDLTKGPLEVRLEKVSSRLLVFGFVIILIVSALGYFQGQAPLALFLSAIGLAVAAIPEGLPTIVTLALTLAARRMTKKNALVRTMTSVETLGSTDVICTDKTGTLTTGQMQVREVFTLNEGLKEASDFKGSNDFYRTIVLCNNASLSEGESGDATEVALLKLAEEHAIDIALMRKENLRSHEWSFESERKRMSVAIKGPDGHTIFCKGAPESLLPLCTLSPEKRVEVEALILKLTSSGRRIIGLASKVDLDKDVSRKLHSEIENHFQFLGLVSMADPPRAEAIKAIEECRLAGIKVVMITGDHPLTARAIADELKIFPKDSKEKVMTGAELNLLSPQELKAKVETTSVYARVTPDHKYKIVEALQANGHVVAMTGDGVNDAPALKKASIGISMGKNGTEVARQASSMVLLDDNFSTIVAAVEEGRAIYGNIKRTIQYLLSTNLAEILIMLGAAVFSLPTPLVPLSLLWINLVTDGFPSLALAAEPLDPKFLKQSGGPSPVSFFDKIFLRELYLVALLMTCITIGVYGYILTTTDLETARSYIFSLMVYLSLFRSFSCRSERKTFFELPANYWHLGSVVVPIGLQLGFQSSAVFQKLFEVRAISLKEHALLLFLSLIPLSIVEIIKVIRRRRTA